MKRYFFISYIGHSLKLSSNGNCTMTCIDCGLNQKKVQEEIKRMSSDDGVELSCVIITNFIELSEKDYKDWTA